MAITSLQLEDAAKRAAAWLASQVTPKGNYKGAESERTDGTYSDTDDIGCYYKSIYTLRAAGQTAAAARCMNYVVKRFRSKEGDYFNTPEVRSSGNYGPVYCQLYQNSWLMRGAAALGWFGVARDILAFMNTQRDPESGGYYTHVGSTTGIMDSCSTAVGAYSCILGGERELARQSCDFLLVLLKNQRDAGILWSRCRKDGTLITDLAEIPEKDRNYVRVAVDQAQQAYWIWSWPMLTLIAMYELSDDKKYLKGALRVFDFMVGCHRHAFSFTTAGKNGWGAGRLYCLTGEERYLEKASSQMQYILEHQHSDGYMVGEGVRDVSGQPRRTTFDYTADFGSWLIDNASEFAKMKL